MIWVESALNQIAWDEATMQLVVSIFGLFATIAISVVVFRAGRKSTKIGHELLMAQERHLAASRLDALERQAGTMTHKEDLAEVIREARSTDNGQRLKMVLRAYWRNPAVPISGGPVPLDEFGIEESRDHLSEKLDGLSPDRAISQLAEFMRKADRFEVSVSSCVAAWVFSQAEDSYSWNAFKVANLVRTGVSDAIYASLIHACRSRAPRDLVGSAEVTAGVCWAFLNRIGVNNDPDRPFTYSAEKSELNRELTDSMFHALASYTYNGGLNDLARSEMTSFSLFPGEVSALLVGAAGAVSFGEPHVAMRTLEGIQKLGISPDQDFGRFEHFWRFGREKFAEYQPDLFEKYPMVVDASEPDEFDDY